MGTIDRTTFLAKLKKSVMTRYGGLTMAERQDMQTLIGQGVDPGTARALVQSYSAVRKETGPGADYLESYVRHAKATLPDWQHALIHRAARGRAGGIGKGRAQMGTEAKKAALFEELSALNARKKAIQAEIGKMSPLASEVHVPVPLGSGSTAKPKRQQDAPLNIGLVTKALVGANDRTMAYAQAAYAGQAPVAPVDADAPDGSMPDPLLEANRLVAGMDAELQSGAQSAEEARTRASQTLRDRPGFYDHVGSPAEVHGLRGLMIDVGSGDARAPGWLGLDLRAPDHGTILHDVSLGLPFPDGSVRALRFHNSLHDILDSDGPDTDPTPLLLECQRVLMEDGRLYYSGPEPLVEPGTRWPLPGLVLEPCNSIYNPPDPGTVNQVLRRVPMRVAAFHGADSTFNPAPQTDPEAAIALWALNDAKASRAMANLVHKQADGCTRVIKADAMRQILTCVVLSPVGVDTQGDVMSAEDIERTAHNYLRQSRIIGAEHGRPIDAHVVESYIAPQAMDFVTPEGKSRVHQGDWIISVHVSDPEEWARVLDGSYEGVSVGGVGERVAA